MSGKGESSSDLPGSSPGISLAVSSRRRGKPDIKPNAGERIDSFQRDGRWRNLRRSLKDGKRGSEIEDERRGRQRTKAGEEERLPLGMKNGPGMDRFGSGFEMVLAGLLLPGMDRFGFGFEMVLAGGRGVPSSAFPWNEERTWYGPFWLRL